MGNGYVAKYHHVIMEKTTLVPKHIILLKLHQKTYHFTLHVLFYC